MARKLPESFNTYLYLSRVISATVRPQSTVFLLSAVITTNILRDRMARGTDRNSREYAGKVNVEGADPCNCFFASSVPT